MKNTHPGTLLQFISTEYEGITVAIVEHSCIEVMARDVTSMVYLSRYGKKELIRVLATMNNGNCLIVLVARWNIRKSL